MTRSRVIHNQQTGHWNNGQDPHDTAGTVWQPPLRRLQASGQFPSPPPPPHECHSARQQNCPGTRQTQHLNQAPTLPTSPAQLGTRNDVQGPEVDLTTATEEGAGVESPGTYCITGVTNCVAHITAPQQVGLRTGAHGLPQGGDGEGTERDIRDGKSTCPRLGYVGVTVLRQGGRHGHTHQEVRYCGRCTLINCPAMLKY